MNWVGFILGTAIIVIALFFYRDPTGLFVAEFPFDNKLNEFLIENTTYFIDVPQGDIMTSFSVSGTATGQVAIYLIDDANQVLTVYKTDKIKNITQHVTRKIGKTVPIARASLVSGNNWIMYSKDGFHEPPHGITENRFTFTNRCINTCSLEKETNYVLYVDLEPQSSVHIQKIHFTTS